MVKKALFTLSISLVFYPFLIKPGRGKKSDNNKPPATYFSPDGVYLASANTDDTRPEVTLFFASPDSSSDEIYQDFTFQFVPCLKALLISYFVEFPNPEKEQTLNEDVKAILSTVRSFLLSESADMNFDYQATLTINANPILIEIVLHSASKRGHQRKVLQRLTNIAAEQRNISALRFFVELGVSSAIVYRQHILKTILEDCVKKSPISTLDMARFLVEQGAEINLFLRLAQNELTHPAMYRTGDRKAFHTVETQRVIEFLQSKMLPNQIIPHDDDKMIAQEIELLVTASSESNGVSNETRDTSCNTPDRLFDLLLNKLAKNSASLAEQTKRTAYSPGYVPAYFQSASPEHESLSMHDVEGNSTMQSSRGHGISLAQTEDEFSAQESAFRILGNRIELSSKEKHAALMAIAQSIARHFEAYSLH